MHAVASVAQFKLLSIIRLKHLNKDSCAIFLGMIPTLQTISHYTLQF